MAEKRAGKASNQKAAKPHTVNSTAAAASGEGDTPARTKRKPVPHCNELGGKRWLQNSISVWSDIRKTPDEAKLKHPAMFPGMLVERLIETFLRPEADRILDPFCGSGSTIVCAERLGKTGIGLELAADYVEMAQTRLVDAAAGSRPRSKIHQASVVDLPSLVEPESVDLCITSPPYWNILNQKRTADYKQVRHYGNLNGDLGTIDDYEQFLDALKTVFTDVFVTLKPGAYCCIIVMDLRKKNRFFPFHSDLAARLTEVGYIFDDLIIWNRQSEYNNLRPLGYPSVFRVNKVHEFVVLMQKPRETG
ncbi:DNA methyltransferase [bacterium]|nr:DNA methyltransferase [bacterium]